MEMVNFKIFLYIIIVFSSVFHEYFHAWTANFLGDPTAKLAGRLTLNPLRHIDPVGTVFLPLTFLFFFNGFIGWAKPVPYNPFNLRDRRLDPAKVGLAGPAANFLIALAFGLFLRFFTASFPPLLFVALTWVVYINIFLGLFNLLPFPPLDGSKLLFFFFPGARWVQVLEQSFVGIFAAIFLAIMFLPALSSILYFFITGRAFQGLAF